MTNIHKICSRCKKPLDSNAPDGLCPECLLQAGLGTDVDMGPDSRMESGQAPFIAPSVEVMSRSISPMRNPQFHRARRHGGGL